MKRLILGSNSPRRRELLKGLGVDFTVDTENHFQENFGPDIPYDEVPRLMAEGKSDGFHRPLLEDEILITADTMVICPMKRRGSCPLRCKPHLRYPSYPMQRMSSHRRTQS